MQENKGLNWLDELDNLIKTNGKLTLILIMQFIVIVILVIGYMKMIDKINVTVELPKTIKEEGIVTVGKEYADNKFFKMWFREDIEIISTFNHYDIKEKMEYVKNRMYPPYYYKYIQIFKEYEAQTSKNLVSQKFTFDKKDIMTQYYSEGEKAKMSIKGFYSKSIGDDIVVDAQPCEYKIGYLIKGGHIYVETFKTNCK